MAAHLVGRRSCRHRMVFSRLVIRATRERGVGVPSSRSDLADGISLSSFVDITDGGSTAGVAAADACRCHQPAAWSPGYFAVARAPALPGAVFPKLRA